ncbi:hypothetical protein RB598_004068 [Gaeumannomyces tritici]
MSVPFSQILQEAPTNPAHVTGYTSGTGKDWATRYPPITGTRLSVHTRNVLGTDGKEATVAGWEAMVPRFSDDQLRLNTLAQRPNRRPYRLDTESDMALWFHTEISNVVLAAWNDTPAVLQPSEAKAWTEQPGMEIADVTYSLLEPGLRCLPPLVAPKTVPWEVNLSAINLRRLIAGFLPDDGDERWVMHAEDPHPPEGDITVKIVKVLGRVCWVLHLKRGGSDGGDGGGGGKIYALTWDQDLHGMQYPEEEAKREAIKFARMLTDCDFGGPQG